MYWSGNTANFPEKETSILQNRFKDSHEALSVFLQSFFFCLFFVVIIRRYFKVAHGESQASLKKVTIETFSEVNKLR